MNPHARKTKTELEGMRVVAIAAHIDKLRAAQGFPEAQSLGKYSKPRILKRYELEWAAYEEWLAANGKAPGKGLRHLEGMKRMEEGDFGAVTYTASYHSEFEANPITTTETMEEETMAANKATKTKKAVKAKAKATPAPEAQVQVTTIITPADALYVLGTVLAWDDDMRPNTDEMSAEEILLELKDNVGQLQPEDETKVDPVTWVYLNALREVPFGPAEVTVKTGPTPKVPKAPKAPKVAKEKKENNAFGHRVGSISATIDEYLSKGKGLTQAEMVKIIMDKHSREESAAIGKFKAHIKHLKGHFTITVKDDKFLLTNKDV
jgi:hypothetical protein